MPSLAAAAACALLVLGLAGCSGESGTGYIEIKSTPPFSLAPLYLDSVKLDPMRNGNALLRHQIGVSRLQTEGEGGSLAVLCSIDVRKNRITTITISTGSRSPRCQCARTGATDAGGTRTCVG